MIASPFSFEPEQLSDQDYQKIGHLSIRWSALEHVTGNCLKAMLRLALRQVEVDRDGILLVADVRIDHDRFGVFAENEVNVRQFAAQLRNFSINDVVGFAKRSKLQCRSHRASFPFFMASCQKALPSPGRMPRVSVLEIHAEP